MITAETVKQFSSLTAPELTEMIRCAGYKHFTFNAVRFIGITNGKEFCYATDDNYGDCRVFVGRGEDGLMKASF